MAWGPAPMPENYAVSDSLPITGSLINRALGVGMSEPAGIARVGGEAGGAMDTGAEEPSLLDGRQSYTAGVPIPGRWQKSYSRPEFPWRRADRSQVELGTSAGAASSSSSYHAPFAEFASSPSPSWHVGSREPELARNMQEVQIDDDIFEGVDVGELMPGSTLTELDAGDDLHDLDVDPLATYTTHDANTTPAANAAHTGYAIGPPPPLVKTEPPEWPTEQVELAPLPLPPPPPPPPGHRSGRRLSRQSLLTAGPAPLGSSAPHGSSAGLASRLSSSVPCDATLLSRTKCRRRDEVRGSASSISTGSFLSPGSHRSFADEAADSQGERDSDSDNDAGSAIGDDDSRNSSLQYKDPYFWQYNVQAKGPKEAPLRLPLPEEITDPYHVRQTDDPVFTSIFQADGINYSGKSRRGECSDLTPSPRRLINIREDLEKLKRQIADIMPISRLPISARPKARKEKTKLTSRICRLKKKAQHEANKIQLSGLNDEHGRLTIALREVIEMILSRADPEGPPIRPEEAGHMVDKIYKQIAKNSVAGRLHTYVQSVLDKYEAARAAGSDHSVFVLRGEPG